MNARGRLTGAAWTDERERAYRAARGTGLVLIAGTAGFGAFVVALVVAVLR